MVSVDVPRLEFKVLNDLISSFAVSPHIYFEASTLSQKGKTYSIFQATVESSEIVISLWCHQLSSPVSLIIPKFSLIEEPFFQLSLDVLICRIVKFNSIALLDSELKFTCVGVTTYGEEFPHTVSHSILHLSIVLRSI